jgi:hypothetical protein
MYLFMKGDTQFLQGEFEFTQLQLITRGFAPEVLAGIAFCSVLIEWLACALVVVFVIGVFVCVCIARQHSSRTPVRQWRGVQA